MWAVIRNEDWLLSSLIYLEGMSQVNSGDFVELTKKEITIEKKKLCFKSMKYNMW